MSEKKSFTLDAESLEALIEAKVAARLAQNAQANVSSDPLAKRLQDAARPEVQEETLVPCESPFTGARYTARVLKSRAWPQGRIVDLLDYKLPPGTDKHMNEGGLVPDGMIMSSPDGKGLTHDYKWWRYTSFIQRDLREFNGKPLQSYCTVEEADRRRAATKAA